MLREDPDRLIELWHFTSKEGKEGILREGKIHATKGSSIWAKGGHTYFSSSPQVKPLVKTIIYGLPPYRQREVSTRFRAYTPGKVAPIRNRGGLR